MIIAIVLFGIGIFLGFRYSYAAVLSASVVTIVAMLGLWGWLGELKPFSALVLIGYLFALQSGYLAGAYIGTPDED